MDDAEVECVGHITEIGGAVLEVNGRGEGAAACTCRSESERPANRSIAGWDRTVVLWPARARHATSILQSADQITGGASAAVHNTETNCHHFVGINHVIGRGTSFIGDGRAVGQDHWRGSG